MRKKNLEGTPPPTGWFPDTKQPGKERYWDGKQWTKQTRTAGHSSAKEQTTMLGRTEADRAKDRNFVKMVGFAFFGLLMVSAVVSSRDGGQTSNSAPPSPVPEQLALVDEAAPLEDPVPRPTAYEVVVTDEIENVKLSLEVFIGEKVSEEALIATAEQIFDKYGGDGYERVFMIYMLPGEEVDDPLLQSSPAWATTHHNPEMKVNYIGSPLAAEQSNDLWLDSLPGTELWRWKTDGGLDTHISLFEMPDGLYELVEVYIDGGSNSYPATLLETDAGLRIESPEMMPNDIDGHLLVTPDGHLERWDVDGRWFRTRVPGFNDAGDQNSG